MPETNKDGYIALRYYQSANKYVRVGGETQFREYLFISGNAGISLAWIHPADVEYVLSMKRRCCGDRESGPMFHYANDADVRIWTGAAER